MIRAVRDNAVSNGFGDVRVIKVNFNHAEINGAIKNLLQARMPVHGNGDFESPMIIGNSPEILKIKKLILDLKASREPVLVQGEPGTGKELVARALHFQSDRHHRPFVKINLAELDSSMLKELFFETLPVSFANRKQIFSGNDIMLQPAEPYFWTKSKPFRRPINQDCSTFLRMAIFSQTNRILRIRPR